MLDFLGFLLAASLVVGVIAGSLYIGLRTSRPYWRMFNTGTQVERLVRLRKLVFGVFLVDLSLLPFGYYRGRPWSPEHCFDRILRRTSAGRSRRGDYSCWDEGGHQGTS